MPDVGVRDRALKGWLFRRVDAGLKVFAELLPSLVLHRAVLDDAGLHFRR